MPRSLNRIRLRDSARDAVLAALDTWAKESGLPLPKDQEGATDADLPALFAAIDAQVDRVIDRSGMLVPDKPDAAAPRGLTLLDLTRLRIKIEGAGYSAAQAITGIRYALGQDATDLNQGFILAMSRILYSDEQLADGARFAVETESPGDVRNCIVSQPPSPPCN